MTSPQSPAPSPSENDSNADDPEWIKGVVAKALLQATAGDAVPVAPGLGVPIDPTPVGRAHAEWPTMSATIPELPPLPDLPAEGVPERPASLPPTTASPLAASPATAITPPDSRLPDHSRLPDPKPLVIPAPTERPAARVPATPFIPSEATAAPVVAPIPTAPAPTPTAPAPTPTAPAPVTPQDTPAAGQRPIPASLGDSQPLPSFTPVPLQTEVVQSIAQRETTTPTGSDVAVLESIDRPVADAAVRPVVDDHVMVETDATTEGYRSSDLRTILEWLAVIVAALVVALLIKAFVLQAFWIPSESMETTVNEGDRILVNKVSYKLHEVRRGDLVVFEKLEGTPGETKDLIKRAIALPGETIEIRGDGRIWIWGPGETPEDAKLLEEPYLDPQNAILAVPSSSDPASQSVWDERCVNQENPGRCTLDENSFFMMGDNRFRSLDSRSFGPVPAENLVGRAFLRIWPPGDVSTL